MGGDRGADDELEALDELDVDDGEGVGDVASSCLTMTCWLASWPEGTNRATCCG